MRHSSQQYGISLPIVQVPSAIYSYQCSNSPGIRYSDESSEVVWCPMRYVMSSSSAGSPVSIMRFRAAYALGCVSMTPCVGTSPWARGRVGASHLTDTRSLPSLRCTRPQCRCRRPGQTPRRKLGRAQQYHRPCTGRALVWRSNSRCYGTRTESVPDEGGGAANVREQQCGRASPLATTIYLVDGGEVQRRQRITLRGCSVSEVGDRDSVEPLHPVGIACTWSLGRAQCCFYVSAADVYRAGMKYRAGESS